MLSNWRRHTFVSGGSDPTQVVTWSDGTITITEFQLVYMVTDKRNRPEVISAVVFAEILHVLLEAEFAEQFDEELNDSYPDLAPFDTDRRIYGGA
jgi:hypothetical protein